MLKFGPESFIAQMVLLSSNKNAFSRKIPIISTKKLKRDKKKINGENNNYISY